MRGAQGERKCSRKAPNRRLIWWRGLDRQLTSLGSCQRCRGSGCWSITNLSISTYLSWKSYATTLSSLIRTIPGQSDLKSSSSHSFHWICATPAKKCNSLCRRLMWTEMGQLNSTNFSGWSSQPRPARMVVRLERIVLQRVANHLRCRGLATIVKWLTSSVYPTWIGRGRIRCRPLWGDTVGRPAVTTYSTRKTKRSAPWSSAKIRNVAPANVLSENHP